MRCVCAVSVGVVCLYLFRLVFSPRSLLLSSLHLFFSSLSSSLLLFCLFCIFLAAGRCITEKAVDLPQRVHLFLLLAAISSTFSLVDVTQHVKKCLKLRREAKIGYVVEAQRHHHQHMQPSPCDVVCHVVCGVVLCVTVHVVSVVWSMVWWCGVVGGRGVCLVCVWCVAEFWLAPERFTKETVGSYPFQV